MTLPTFRFEFNHNGPANEHTVGGMGALLVGLTAGNYIIWNGIRGIDYLLSRQEIDAQRIGCTGNSGGGTLTAYLMAIDERIRAAAPSCWLTTPERMFHTMGRRTPSKFFRDRLRPVLNTRIFCCCGRRCQF